ncbi:MAG TPA: cyclic 2,3-diphosphoglycerate synthase [Candidatus Limnocylindrales bacterium]
MQRKRVLIMGAAGRDFHVFNVVYRDDPAVEVVAFTATQIPGIADRRYPAQLAGAHYPQGIPILAEDELEALIRGAAVDEVVFAYSDVSHETVMHAASRAMAAGADFALLGPRRTMLPSRRPVLAVGGTRTGVGKSQTSRYLAGLVDQHGVRPIVVRHPMPYGDLRAQRVQRFETYDDLARHEATIEEREEYEPHIAAGHVVYAGVDYGDILHAAEEEAELILWDGGNNDLPFYRPDLFVVVADPLRPGDERRYHPGETNLRLADVVVINKIDSAGADAIDQVRASIAELNPRAEVITARSELALEGPAIAGKRVVVVEDGPTLTHGGMTYGAGVVAARRFGAGRLVDPRPAAVGSLVDVLERYPLLEPLVPAMGYGTAQMADLAATLNAVDADIVLVATPIDLGRLLTLNKPVTRVRYDIVQVSGRPLAELVEPLLAQARNLREPLAIGAR